MFAGVGRLWYSLGVITAMKHEVDTRWHLSIQVFFVPGQALLCHRTLMASATPTNSASLSGSHLWEWGRGGSEDQDDEGGEDGEAGGDDDEEPPVCDCVFND